MSSEQCGYNGYIAIENKRVEKSASIEERKVKFEHRLYGFVKKKTTIKAQ